MPPDLLNSRDPHLFPAGRGEAGALSAGARSATRERRSPLGLSPSDPCGSLPRRLWMRVGDTCQAHRCAGGPQLYADHTDRSRRENRRARFPAARCGRVAPHRRRHSAPPLRLASPVRKLVLPTGGPSEHAATRRSRELAADMGSPARTLARWGLVLPCGVSRGLCSPAGRRASYTWIERSCNSVGTQARVPHLHSRGH